ncbi:unnamed protein product [Owenia fusiformis]|uniref:Uncharacterized protein n=1 Tax=Owenia fusiformis TaxID=6347 RepID=A0A8S4N3Q5_OWEFU|nr:unnamed protein product [Owenia fusiformis]
MDITSWILVLINIALLLYSSGHCSAESLCDDASIIDNEDRVCYLKSDSPASWSKAGEDCGKKGGELPVLSDAHRNDFFVNALRKESMDDIWIGANQTASHWHWLSGAPILEQGCYLDFETRDFEERALSNAGNLTYDYCIDQCSTYKFAGLQAGRECWCGNSFNKYGVPESREEWCATPCSGQGDRLCGDSWKNTVLAIGGLFTSWAETQPNNYKNHQDCAATNREGIWFDETCTMSFYYLCDIDRSEEDCRGMDGIFINSSCVTLSTEKRSWFEATNACQSKMGNLLEIESEQFQDDLKQRLRSRIGDREKYWINLVKTRWQWSTGDPVMEFHWSENHPNVSTDQCVAMVENEGRYMWQITPCDQPRNYLCQIVMPEETTTTEAPTTTSTTTTTTTVPTTTKKPTTEPPTPEPETTTEDQFNNWPTSEPGPAESGDDDSGTYSGLDVGVVIALSLAGALLIFTCIFGAFVCHRALKKSRGGRKLTDDGPSPINGYKNNNPHHQNPQPHNVYELNTNYVNPPAKQEVKPDDNIYDTTLKTNWVEVKDNTENEYAEPPNESEYANTEVINEHNDEDLERNKVNAERIRAVKSKNRARAIGHDVFNSAENIPGQVNQGTDL